MEEIKKILEKLQIKEPLAEFKLTYDSPFQQLEPIYYWILDFTRNLGFNVEKLVDNFGTSPGGGYSSELGRKAGIMQEKVISYLKYVNEVVKSIINLIYDLKQFEIRLSLYDKLKSKNPIEREGALNALKEIWITFVDAQKGRGSINELTRSLEFVTLRDAFFAAKTIDDVYKLDLNDRVRRLLLSRLSEFNQWLQLSEVELRNRYKLEKNYLKSQVASLKLYTRWLKPYLRAAEGLLEKETREASLVSIFSTIILNLLLQCFKKYDINILPKELKEYFKKKKIRNFYGLIFIDFNFRSIPHTDIRKQEFYIFTGRVDLNFKAYVLNEDQFNFFKKELEKSEFEEVIKLFTDLTEESLKIMEEDLKKFLEEKKEEIKEKKSTLKQGIITDLINIFKGKEKKEEKEKKEKILRDVKEINKENYYEKYLRGLVEEEIKDLCFSIYNTFKKSKGMPGYPSPYKSI
ncbi:MAG: hypothetical protein QXO12_01870 [Candidatus Pacearchaeota archaeon]